MGLPGFKGGAGWSCAPGAATSGDVLEHHCKAGTCPILSARATRPHGYPSAWHCYAWPRSSQGWDPCEHNSRVNTTPAPLGNHRETCYWEPAGGNNTAKPLRVPSVPSCQAKGEAPLPSDNALLPGSLCLL